MIKAIDLFAGAGGFTEGATQAGVNVVWAANHWPKAVEIHANNHPKTIHTCQDLQQANWASVPNFDLLLASPACQGHSRARGKDRPHHDALRSTAFAVIACAEIHLPKNIIVENVPEFMKWQLYPIWKKGLEILGYKVTENILNAADFGVPQSRERLFVVATRAKKGIEIEVPNVKRIAASSFIDLRVGSFSPVKKEGRAESTLAQWRAGKLKHGRNFLLAYYGAEKHGRSLSKPIGTITTKDRYAVIRGDEMRMLTIKEVIAAMGFPEDYIFPMTRTDTIKMLGNAVPPPLARAVIEQVAC